MPILPTLPVTRTYRDMTDTFAGYDHNLKIPDGSFFDTENLTTEFYPLLATRRKRGWVKNLFGPGGLIDKVYLAYIDEGILYLNDSPTALTGLTGGDKQLVGFGAYICIFPDKKYYNTADPTDYGDMAEDPDDIPEMDFVIECKNRLWGCKYGVVNGQNINEIYACELGNFANWTEFEGISTDPYTASVGSDGPWTGAINYMGYPTFFKEDRIHRVAVSAIGAHEITETVCDGVQAGSHGSLQVVNGLLYYKTNTGIVVYQGGTAPTPISAQLGDVKYSGAVAGVLDRKYYVSMLSDSGSWHLFCYDSTRGLWMREDGTHAKYFATVGNELYMLNDRNEIWALNGTTGEPEETVDWYAESGTLYYAYPDHKYVSRFDIRLDMEAGARIRVLIDYNSEGRWMRQGEIIMRGMNSKVIPVRPRRCDHCRIRLEGRGTAKIYSIARILEIGSDY